MDRFADSMIARGPTLAADRESWTGSLHILGLPDAQAAQRFVEHEPYNRAGLFEQHVIRGFRDLLGRTMWEFAGAPDDPRFLLMADANPGALRVASERLIIHGELLTPDESRPAGVAMALAAPTRDAVDALIGHADGVQVLDWEFGGRR
jgi:uncharacterized protein